MANINKYPLKDFSTSQKFLAGDNTGTTVRVTGQSMLDANIESLKASGKVVNSIDTLTEAIAGNYQSGIYLLVGGGTVTLDGDQAIYRVSDAGSGGIVMANGNELVLLFSGPTVKSVANVSSLFGLTGVAGQQISVGEYNASSSVGSFAAKWRADLARTVHDGIRYHSPSRNLTSEGLTAYLVASTDAVLGVWENIETILTVQMAGALVDGVNNDTVPLQAFDAFGGGLITGGIVRVIANIALVSDYQFLDGGIIAPDSSYTITWSGAITAGDYKIFDGNFTLTKVHKVDEVLITWFGALSTDILITLGQSGAVDDVTLGNANGKAIRQANAMVNIGVPNGIYITPVLKIPTGIFIVDDDNNSGEIFNLDSYMTIKGNGWSSVIRPINGAKAFSVLKCVTDAANNIYVDDFQIYGEASAQTNTQHGINISPATNPVIYSRIGPSMNIKEMNGNGIRVAGAGMDNSTIEPARVRDSSLSNLFVNACDRITVRGGLYRSAKSGNHGILFDGPACVSAIIQNNRIDENNGSGLFLSNVTGRFLVQGNRLQSNFTGNGIYLDRVNDSIISENFIEQSGQDGMLIDQCNRNNINNNRVASNARFGMLVASSSDNQIANNFAYSNGSLLANTYDGINIQSNSDNNNIQSNTVRNGTDQRYGLRINDAASATNMVLNNDLLNSGTTASFSDAGTGTITTSGNRI